MDRPVLAVLEDAELRARSRRLQASAEAERRLADGAARAAAIEAGVPAIAAGAIAQARAASSSRLAAALEAIRAEAATLEPPDASPGTAPAVTIDEAVELIVGTVLGEREG